MFKNSDCLAKIAVEKSLLKEYNVGGCRTVYMNDNTEFQIQLYNDTSDDIGVKVFINNNPMKSMLILRPAERCWLERYTDRAVKLKFTVYSTDGSEKTKEIIADNGVVRVEFYKRKREPIYYYYEVKEYPRYYGDWLGGYGTSISTTTAYFSSSSLGHCDTCLDSTAPSLSTTTLTDGAVEKAASLIDGAVYPGKNSANHISKRNTTIETGRIESGGKSDQAFETTSMDFETTPFRTEKIKILPMSAKPVQPGDLQKTYCPECGRKLNSKYKYCPYCGTKLEETE